MNKRPPIKRVGGYYWFQSQDFLRKPLWGLSRCITDSCSHVAGIVIEYGEPIKF